MIEFEQISVKNFCSYGNNPSTIILNKDSNTLVVGKNGRGKSTILLDGVFFALFGKPYRKVTKSQLVNSINNGGTLVEIVFNTRGSKYIVRRGIKPNLFEVVKDGDIIDSNVMSKDLQEHLEQDILQLNIKTFGQTTVLGSTSYTPFMQLDAAKRREVVDDVLAVGVYTKMSKLAKEDLDITSKEITNTNHQIEIIKNSILSQKKLIDVMSSNRETVIQQFRDQLEELDRSIELTQDELNKVEDEISGIVVPEDLGYDTIIADLRKLKNSVSSIQQKVDDIESLTSCPTCLQRVSDEHKQIIKDKSSPKIQDMTVQITDLEAKLVEAKKVRDVIDEMTQRLEVLRQQKRDLQRDLSASTNRRKTVEASLTEASESNAAGIEAEKKKMEDLAKQGKALVSSLSDLKVRKSTQELAVQLLKDNGIKARVVKEYLPVINTLINKYLKGYEFDINFELDENFNETIKSRGRQGFSYHSFSEGEKEKIDYAIMLALRQIAASKNAAHINILILDEILDGSLDEESRSATLNMLSQDVEKSNIFVISHTESNPGYYDTIIKVDKKGDFSFLTEVI